MRSLFAALVFLFAGTVLAGERCSAIDGSTLKCGNERVKIEGINATSGKDARDRLQQRLQKGEVVIERRGTDKYGRTLGRLFVDGQRITQVDVNARPGANR